MDSFAWTGAGWISNWICHKMQPGKSHNYGKFKHTLKVLASSFDINNDIYT